ncbi:hypothetical protein C8F04DRAFT_1296523 [Mycena alexandri]|uniref:Uncharacterized protein n=1 Tax=Mycena alexandri TaxID=1745969 RepID=A0AAD6SFR8_9AGAR|nr:hypothetical protein C8F04DRAFT_1296523 [Mycena alexandri]
MFNCPVPLPPSGVQRKKSNGGLGVGGQVVIEVLIFQAVGFDGSQSQKEAKPVIRARPHQRKIVMIHGSGTAATPEPAQFENEIQAVNTSKTRRGAPLRGIVGTRRDALPCQFTGTYSVMMERKTELELEELRMSALSKALRGGISAARVPISIIEAEDVGLFEGGISRRPNAGTLPSMCECDNHRPRQAKTKSPAGRHNPVGEAVSGTEERRSQSRSGTTPTSDWPAPRPTQMGIPRDCGYKIPHRAVRVFHNSVNGGIADGIRPLLCATSRSR